MQAIVFCFCFLRKSKSPPGYRAPARSPQTNRTRVSTIQLRQLRFRHDDDNGDDAGAGDCGGDGDGDGVGDDDGVGVGDGVGDGYSDGVGEVTSNCGEISVPGSIFTARRLIAWHFFVGRFLLQGGSSVAVEKW